MLTTLLPIDEGQALVAGYDVRTKPGEVRKRVGYVGQLGGADDLATGREDLLLQAQLHGMSLASAAERAAELADVLDLTAFIDRKVKTYSGGQRRRLDVALGIMHRPEVLFLDEPTTGLDPQNRANLWDQLRKLRDMGTTIFLTTHYLEEADALSDELAIMDHGVIVTRGTPRELKNEIAGDAVIIEPKDDGMALETIQDCLKSLSIVRDARREGETIRVYVDDGARSLPKIFTLLEAQGVSIESISLSRPSLDDVFLRETGRSLRDTDTAGKGA
jgi:ABC-2 type transport system ATP-binding protein